MAQAFRLLRAVALSTLLLLAAAPGSADVAIVVNSDGSDPTALPNLQIPFGNVLFDVPTAKVFGLDVDNNFAPLPDADRFPNDLRDFLAKDKFLTAPDVLKKSRGLLISSCEFNNPNPAANPNDIAKILFTIPLVDAFGAPLGGTGQRWVHLQFGPHAADPGGGAGDPDPGAEGTGGGHLSPPSTPLRKWASFIGGMESDPGESEDDFRARVKAAIAAAKKSASASSLMKYMKLVDDSDFDDPHLNYIAELRNDGGVPSMDVELGFMIEKGTFLRVARWIDNLTIAVTNDSSLLPLDPNNQPPGELLMATGVVDFGGGGGGGDTGMSVVMGDIESVVTTTVDATVSNAVASGALEVTFQVAGSVLDGDGATNYLEIQPTSFDPPGAIHRIPYDQPVDATAADLAADLTFMVNNWPVDGEFKYFAEPLGAKVQIRRFDGRAIAGATLVHTLEATSVHEVVEVSPAACNADADAEQPCGPKEPEKKRPLRAVISPLTP